MGDWEDQTHILLIMSCELCLTSGLPTYWRACAIDPDVAFWCDYLSPA